MSPTNATRKQRRPLPPTPRAPIGCGVATQSEALVVALGKALADIVRNHVACKPMRMTGDTDAEFHATMQKYQADSVFTIVAILKGYPHIEEAVWLSMVDVRRQDLPFVPEWYGMLQVALLEAEPGLTNELKNTEVARIAAMRTHAAEKKFVHAQGKLFAGIEGCAQ